MAGIIEAVMGDKSKEIKTFIRLNGSQLRMFIALECFAEADKE